MHKKRMKPHESLSFQHVVSRESQPLWVLALYGERSKEKRVVSMPTTLGSHEMICMHACRLAWWAEHVSISLWKPVSCCLCVCRCAGRAGGYSELGSVGVCEISPGWGACVSDVNSALSARFSTLPAAVKRARPSLPPPPPRGLISFFILSAIQLDFLRGHRGQGPFTKRWAMGVFVCACTAHPDFSRNNGRKPSVRGFILFTKCFLCHVSFMRQDFTCRRCNWKRYN